MTVKQLRDLIWHLPEDAQIRFRDPVSREDFDAKPALNTEDSYTALELAFDRIDEDDEDRRDDLDGEDVGFLMAPSCRTCGREHGTTARPVYRDGIEFCSFCAPADPNRVTFTHTVRCPEGSYDVVVVAKLEAPAPECGDPGGWRLSKWKYQSSWGDEMQFEDRDTFAGAFGQTRLDEVEQMACDAAILEHEGMKIEGSDAA